MTSVVQESPAAAAIDAAADRERLGRHRGTYRAMLPNAVWYTVCNRGTRLDLFERGLVVSRRGRVRVVRYDSTRLCRRVVRSAKDRVQHECSCDYTLIDTAGAPVRLQHGIERAAQWGPAVERAVTEAQLPAARAALAAGERLDFEHFWMTATELGVGDRSVPWSRVSQIGVVGGWLSVRVAGESQPLESLPISLIPNFAIFRALSPA
ncbi:DUF6585 family protein [Nocardia terpenica]|uniref:Uncharacterized protein n=1 Tax=Nocardia terpenica TaxID=455432 RepID=A0A291RDT0_9NOCA|nr:DUF6585 family protein [Nocardia terpenica]ATL65733.1 hypothetical protein CRH09_05410 [Nocardia terpenica]